ncbi:hypothetical protein EDC01DRAFT_789721 [Geopyxis carbonaria]|nr:hypothetical protein EDC01DRAFT_789721 [Geopyxis carbonaria]
MPRGRSLHPTKTHQLAYWDKYQRQPDTLPVSIDDRRATNYAAMGMGEKYGEGDTPIGQQAASIIGGTRPVMIGLSIEQAAEHKQQYAQLYGNEQSQAQGDPYEQQCPNEYLFQFQQGFPIQEQFLQNGQNNICQPTWSDIDVDFMFGNASAPSFPMDPLDIAGGSSEKRKRNKFPPMPKSTPSPDGSPNKKGRRNKTPKPERMSRADPPSMTKTQHSIAAAFGNIDKHGRIMSKYAWMNETAAPNRPYGPTPPPDDPRWTIYNIGRLFKDPVEFRRLGLTTPHLRTVIMRMVPDKTGIKGLGVPALVEMIEDLRGETYNDEGYFWWDLIPETLEEMGKANIEEDTRSLAWNSGDDD